MWWLFVDAILAAAFIRAAAYGVALALMREFTR
jgi:hypothetical protein